MARIRTLTVGIAAWAALATTAPAAPVSWFDSQAALTAWYANQINNPGSVYATGGSSAVTNLPTNWYFQPSAAATTFTAQSQAAPAAAPVAVAAQSVQATTLAASPSRADAFVNLGTGPYGDASITTGDARPWYQSPAAAAVYGGAPSASQQAGFDRDVLSKVQQTFALSGIDLKVTGDPNVPAAHMLSVVSGASYKDNPDAIGITQVGGDGYSFIDKLNYASNPDQLAWAVAHNVAHELMHAEGVASHPDATGAHVDSATADWSMLTDPKSSFSPAAVALIKSAMANGADASGLGAELLDSAGLFAHDHAEGGLEGAQVLAAPVPEPATVAVWMVGLVGGMVLQRRGRRGS